jgi:hypothetical protein
MWSNNSLGCPVGHFFTIFQIKKEEKGYPSVAPLMRILKHSLREGTKKNENSRKHGKHGKHA